MRDWPAGAPKARLDDVLIRSSISKMTTMYHAWHDILHNTTSAPRRVICNTGNPPPSYSELKI